MIDQIVERWNEYIARRLREKLNAAGAFIVSCPHPASEDPRECNCFLGRNFAWCESDALCGQYAQHDVGGALLCTMCRDFAYGHADHEPTVAIPAETMADLMLGDGRRPAQPSAGELDAELRQHAEAGS